MCLSSSGNIDIVFLFCLNYLIRNCVVVVSKISIPSITQRRAPGQPQPENAQGAGFVGDEIDQAAVFLLELLGGLADFAAEDDLALVEFLREAGEGGFVGKGEQDNQSALPRSVQASLHPASMSPTSNPAPGFSAARGSRTPMMARRMGPRRTRRYESNSGWRLA